MNAISSTTAVLDSSAAGSSVNIQRLNELALRGLDRMFDRDNQLFCHHMRMTGGKLLRQGLSRRYTLISLLGLQKAENAGYSSPVPIADVTAKLLHDFRRINNLGDLGLLIWLAARVIPDQLVRRSFDIDLLSALDRYPDAREARTMELSWFLTGLAECALAHVPVVGGHEQLATKVWRLLRNNCGKHGYFVQSARGKGIAGVIRGRIGSFAEQVYPIYALSRCSQAYGSEEGLQIATTCAQAICDAQGPLGQWWWHYDATQGNVIGRYPVYSVHQHGMAPLALFAVTEAGTRDFTPYIYRGLQWIAGDNELQFDMRSESDDVIWRSIYRQRRKRIVSEALNLTILNGHGGKPSGLGVKWDCCPYELGWLLFALAGVSPTHA
jgi:hypothetical protein